MRDVLICSDIVDELVDHDRGVIVFEGIRMIQRKLLEVTEIQ
jgi:hypothetical protein